MRDQVNRPLCQTIIATDRVDYTKIAGYREERRHQHRNREDPQLDSSAKLRGCRPNKHGNDERHTDYEGRVAEMPGRMPARREAAEPHSPDRKKCSEHRRYGPPVRHQLPHLRYRAHLLDVDYAARDPVARVAGVTRCGGCVRRIWTVLGCPGADRHIAEVIGTCVQHDSPIEERSGHETVGTEFEVDRSVAIQIHAGQVAAMSTVAFTRVTFQMTVGRHEPRVGWPGCVGHTSRPIARGRVFSSRA